MSNVKNNAATQETCRKLIDAAGQVFAERGLHGATIKEITELAGTNLAAVNYHFRDKFELYAAVIRHALTFTSVLPSSGELAGSPNERLRLAIQYQIEDIFDPNRPAWRAPLLAHEFAQPTEALDAVMEELLRPRSDLIRGIVRDFLGPTASETQVMFATFSIGAQSVFYLFHVNLTRRLYPDLFGPESVEEVAAHIAEFSLSALRGMRDKGKKTGRRRS